MNKEIRWRILSLQAMLVVILAAASGFLFFQGNFVTGMVHDQLVAQKIFFPGTDQVKAGGDLAGAHGAAARIRAREARRRGGATRPGRA